MSSYPSYRQAVSRLRRQYAQYMNLRDEARCYLVIMEIKDYTMKKAGSMFGKSESYVSKLLYVYDNAGEKQWDVIIGDGMSVNRAYKLLQGID